MIRNGNSDSAFNDFSELPSVPYRIVRALLEDDSEEAEMFWKLLVYSQPDALEKPNLTEDEKADYVWSNETLENDFHVFFKPLVGSALDTAEAQTQMRVYRSTGNPINRMRAVENFEIIFTTNEKESMVRNKGIPMERTDLLENLFLSLMNGRDLGVGIGTLIYDDELSRSCGSNLGINNSKNFYGRALVMALTFMGAGSDDRTCG